MTPRERQAELRDAARHLVALRELTIRAEVYYSQGWKTGAHVIERRMEIHGKLLPRKLRRSIALARYVGAPVARKIRREGLASQAARLGIPA